MNERNQEILRYITKSKNKLASAILNFENSYYDDAASRAYYCVYHAICSVLLLEDKEFSSHNQTLGYFNKEFIHKDIFPRLFGKWIYQLFEHREIGDYSIEDDISESKAKELIEYATTMLNSIIEYVENNLVE